MGVMAIVAHRKNLPKNREKSRWEEPLVIEAPAFQMTYGAMVLSKLHRQRWKLDLLCELAQAGGRGVLPIRYWQYDRDLVSRSLSELTWLCTLTRVGPVHSGSERYLRYSRPKC